MKESEIETYLRDEVIKRGGKAFKFSSPGNNGVPDRAVILPGIETVYVELKKPGKKLTRFQQWRKNQFEKLGAKVYVIDSKELVDKMMNSLEVKAHDL